MYDMYPEWGSGAHDAEHPFPSSGPSTAPAHRRPHRWDAAPLAAPDQRERTGDRPDDH